MDGEHAIVPAVSESVKRAENFARKRRRSVDGLVGHGVAYQRARGTRPAYESRLLDIAPTRTSDNIFNYRHLDEGSDSLRPTALLQLNFDESMRRHRSPTDTRPPAAVNFKLPSLIEPFSLLTCNFLHSLSLRISFFDRRMYVQQFSLATCKLRAIVESLMCE